MREQYKYVLDVDGNGWSGRFHRCVLRRFEEREDADGERRLMASNSLVLKSTIFPEWCVLSLS